MLILLPPSEGKSEPKGRRPVNLDRLVFADRLTEPRLTLLEGLEALCSGPPEAAVETLGISAKQVEEVSRNLGLMTAPAGPASTVYTGVLYDRLGFDTLSPRGRHRARQHLLIASGLWGLLRPGDRIPRYRFSMKPKLAGIGGLAAFWREPLAEAMTAANLDRPGDLVLDLRSGAYATAWRPREARLLPVRGFTETADGGRKTISHMAKTIRGEVARITLEADSLARSAEDVAGLLEAADMQVELRSGSIDVIVSA